MQKNPILLKKRSEKPSVRPKTQTKTNYSCFTSFTVSRKQLPLLAKTKDVLEQAVTRVGEAGQMIEAMGMEGAQSTIFKYIKKYMESKAFHYSELITEILLSQSLPRANNKNELNSELLFF